ncbi:hypothetical protein MRX96_003441 [Rhipicephalus microplus]
MLAAGNVGDKFQLEAHTGRLLASAPLDREAVSEYRLTVVATDQGSPTRTGSCTLVVTVLDENDEPPLRAHDPDLGPGGRVSYSLANETAALFRIDSDTGVLTTTGLFDREKCAGYSFEVRASDSGRYQAHWAHARVQVTVVDVNDNIALVQAHDGDDGPNADVFYTTPSGGKLHLDTDTGLVTVAASLVADNGRLLRLDLVARDRGRPSRMASGVLEVWVGPVAGLRLDFSNASYVARLPEGAAAGSTVLHVQASAMSQPGLAVTYSLGPDQDQGPFVIHRTSGTVSVRDSKQLDYEERPELELPLWAHAETPSGAMLHGYARLLVQLLDQNDNSPRFSQERYVASVWEGCSRGTFVAQVSALDADRGSGLVYHIAVLDREIRDTYMLTLVATDDGQPPRTGSCTLHITVIDANDNQPVFPPDSVVSIREDARVGSTVTTITANDVDTHPVLRYSLAEPRGTFVVDHFSGRLLLAEPLDYEQQREYQLRLHVSDTTHVAETLVTIRVLDTNDHAPRFLQPFYNVPISESAALGSSVVTVSATDLDSGDNANIHYSFAGFSDGFYIDKQTGTVYTNGSLDLSRPVMQLLVRATDNGHPTRSSVVPLRMHLADINHSAPKFLETVYRASVPENTLPGSTLLRVSASDQDGRVEYRLLDTASGRVVGPPTFTQARYEVSISEGAPLGHTVLHLGPLTPGLRYAITSGNRLGCFQVDASGDLVVAAKLDYDVLPEQRLVVRASDSSGWAALTSVLVHLQDENDHAPQFPLAEYVASVEEGAPMGSPLLVARAVDGDRGPFGKLNYSLVEGTQLVGMDSSTGALTSAVVFDYEAQSHYQLTVRATDSGGRWATARIHVHVLSRDEFIPVFDQEEYRFAVPLGAPVGFVIGHVHATDRDRGPDGRVLYQIRGGSAHFRVNASSGTLSVRAPWSGGTRLEVVASSGRRGSLMASTGVTLEEAPAAPAAASASHGLPAWALALLLLALTAVAGLAAAVVLLRGRLQTKRTAEPNLDTSFDTVDLRRDPFPAFYERPDDAAGAMHTSEVSEQSSGRGSAEDEDEEIRMINEGLRPQGDSGSDMSVRNTHEYLARLGIDPAAPIDSWAKAPSAPADDEDLSSLLYAKLDEPAESLGAVDDSYAAALSPSFSPALLPLASRSPSPLPCLRRTQPDS